MAIDIVARALAVSGKLNIENGEGAGSLKQKDPTYDGLVDALMPYNRSYVEGTLGYTSSNDTKAKTILVNSGFYTTKEANDYITINGSEPKVVEEALAKGQLKGYHNIEPDTDLSNKVTEAAASSFLMGIQNKAYSPLMFVGGMNCEAGSKDSSSYLISSFTFGRDLKNYSLDSIMTGLGTNSYKLIKNQNDAYKGQQRCYLNYLAEAGGQVTGEGDDRVAVTGVNEGPSCVVLGNYHFSKGECNVLLGNQNIINGGDNVAIGLHNYMIGNVHLSACIGVQNAIKGTGSYDCYGNFLIGRSLRLEGGKHRVAIGISNAKADDASVLFMIGNGDEDATSSETQRRSNAFEVLKDGRAKVQSAPTESTDVVRKLELDKKLDKPITPTAESAVVLGTDGTVSTKPLSELGGGGGKLYIHSITIKADNTKVIEGRFLSTRGTNYDVTDDFSAYFLPCSTITIDSVKYGITIYNNMPSNGYRSYDNFNIATYEESGGPVYNTPTFSNYFVTEL